MWQKRITLSKSTFCLNKLNSLCPVKAEDNIHNKRTRSSSTLYCRQLESGIVTTLKLNEGYFEAPSVLSKEGEKQINCWILHTDTTYCELDIQYSTVQITTCASTSGGWGVACTSIQTGGCCEWKTHKILTDSDCAVLDLKKNKMGGSVSEDCNSVAYRIWKWFQDRNTWLTVAFVNERQNTDAGRHSTKVCDNTFWRGQLLCCKHQKLIYWHIAWTIRYQTVCLGIVTLKHQNQVSYIKFNWSSSTFIHCLIVYRQDTLSENSIRSIFSVKLCGQFMLSGQYALACRY